MVNPLGFKSDQHQISSDDTNTVSSRENVVKN